MNFLKRILVVCLLVTSLFTLGGCSTTVDLSKYVTIDVSGYNTVGTASAYFDEEQFIADYGDKIKLDVVHLEEGMKNYLESMIKYSSLLSGEELNSEDYYSDEDIQSTVEDLLYDYDNGAECLVDFVKYFMALDKKSQLSNGDKVTLSWFNATAMIGEDKASELTDDQKKVLDDVVKEWINALNEMFNVNLKTSSKTITVEGLEEISMFNPFDNLTVTFSGIAPNGYVDYSINNSFDGMSSIYFSVEGNDGGLNVGDKVTIKAEYYGSEEDFANKYGKIMSTTEKEYTVDGLDAYLTSASQIDDNTLSSMKSQINDAFESYRASNWDDEETLTSFNYIGNYVLTRKSGDSWNTQNYVVLVYKVELSANGSPVAYYTYYAYDDIVVKADGSIDIDLMSYSTPYNTYDSDVKVKGSNWSTYRYKGYESLDSLYKNAIQTNIEYYNIENNVGE